MRSFLLALLVLFPCSLFAIQKDSTISLSTPSGKIFGTLTLPFVKTSVPLVVVIAGSGPTDRDGNQGKMKNNSLLALGDSLAKKGIATFRYDKRGTGASRQAAPDESSLRFDDYVSDAADWVKKFQQDKRFSKIYIAGHSEGSLVGMLAAQRVRVDGFISIAGAAQPADSIIFKQLTASSMITAGMVDTMRMLFGLLRKGERIEKVPDGFYQALLRPSVQPYVMSWIKYTPAEEIAKLKVPVLIIQGTTDIQVDTEEAQALAKAKPGAKLVIIKNMNHVLKDMPSREIADNQLSYVDPGFLLKRELTPAIASFIFPGVARKK
jgi:pimeloyl-ACP methyl ester carboxylesterase